MPVDADQYPVNLVLTPKPRLVAGGGPVPLRAVEGLLADGAQVTVIAPEVEPAIRALGGVTVHERRYAPPEAGTGGYRLVVTATADTATDQQVHDDADAAGVWVNGADDPER